MARFNRVAYPLFKPEDPGKLYQFQERNLELFKLYQRVIENNNSGNDIHSKQNRRQKSPGNF